MLELVERLLIMFGSLLPDTNSQIAMIVGVVLAVVTPFVFIVVQHEVRISRIRLIEEFRRNFLFDRAPDAFAPPPSGAPNPSAAEPATAPAADGEGEADAAAQPKPKPKSSETARRLKPTAWSPSFEFVVTKYIVDLFDICSPQQLETIRQQGSSSLTTDELYALIQRSKLFRIGANRRLLLVFVPYAFAVWAMVQLVLGNTPEAVTQALARLGGPECATLLAAGELGAYFFTLRQLLRAVTNFDLTGRTAVRMFGQFALTAAVVLVLSAMTSAIVSGGTGGVCTDQAKLCAMSAPMIALAFVIGVMPEAGLQFIYTAGRQLATGNKMIDWAFSFLKRTDNRFNDLVASTSLDVIDGIDYGTRYRLEDVGLYEVQNLATANPILVHIESPYGIYEVIDWVAQAQLCTIVGLERFVLLQQYSIRTIFDLERAVMSRRSTHELRQIIGAILFSPNATLAKAQEAAGGPGARVLRPLEQEGSESFPDAVMRLVARRTTTEIEVRTAEGGETRWARVEQDDASILHAVRVMLDDLHVHRLREIWERIGRTLGYDAERLDDSVD